MTLCLSSHVEMHKLSVGNFVKTNGVWDPASQYCDENGKVLEEVTARVKMLSVMSAPPGVGLVPLPYPTAKHHAVVTRIGDWIQSYLASTYPAQKTGFTLQRTLLVAPFMSALFTDLQTLFYAVHGTTLPPTVAVYLMINALRVHRMRPEDFERLCHKPNRTTSDAFRLLRLIRDVLVGWTMCRVEGRYNPDTCLGKPSDDQPCKNTSKPGIRVFDADDCEVPMPALYFNLQVD